MLKKQEILNSAKLAKSILDTEVKLKSMEADRAVLTSHATLNIRDKMESSLGKLIHLLEEEE